MSTFLVASDETLVARIDTAKSRIVFVSPGLSKEVAGALARRFAEANAPAITIVLDADPEVCRLGYGDAEALETLHEAAKAHQRTIQHCSGVRIGLLMADDSLLVFSPTPLLIEAGSISPQKPNAIDVSSNLPEALSKAVGEEGAALLSEAEIGTEPIRDSLVEELKHDLDIAPARDFDVARQERVFNALLEYVEFEVKDYQLSTRVATIPPAVLGLAGDDQQAARWRNGYRVFDVAERLEVDLPRTIDDVRAPPLSETVRYGVKDIDRERREIAAKFLLTVPNFDVLIPRSDRTAFDERIARFRDRLKTYAKKVEATLEARVEEARQQLLDRVIPQVLKDPPQEYLRRTLGSRSPEELGELVTREIDRAFASLKGDYKPRVEVRYKSLTYETIKNPAFRKALEQLMPSATIDRMFKEHEAAPSESSRRTITPSGIAGDS